MSESALREALAILLQVQPDHSVLLLDLLRIRFDLLSAFSLAACALQVSDDRPLLVHCVKGTHRTGCLVACLRKCQARFPWHYSRIRLALFCVICLSYCGLNCCSWFDFAFFQGWSLSSIFDEYRRFTEGNFRLLDLQFIDLFSPDPSRPLQYHLKVI
jgi:tyrosine-protein phosphatase SIW14